MHTADIVGSEEVFTRFSCLKLSSMVQAAFFFFKKPDIPSSLQISQVFHTALVSLVTFSVSCLSLAELEEFPLHTPLVISC